MARRHSMGTSIAVTTFLLALASSALASSPRLSVITPRGVQRGGEHVLTFSGSNLGDAQEVFFYSPGFEVSKVEPDAKNVKVHVKVAPDCRLGEHVAQVRTASGISDYRTFYVGALAAVTEKEPNSDFEAPQEVSLNVTMEGVVQNEDVDYYKIQAKKGQRLAVEVEAMRLGTTLFDPYVAILDSKRFELASDDDTPLLMQDAAASVVAPEDGTYVIEVRDSAYGGNGNCRYRLHIGTFPRPLAVYPAGGKMGEEVEVRFLGAPTGEFVQKFKLPAEPDPEYGLFANDDGGIAPSPNPFRLFEHGNAFEKEPNNGLAEASPAELPLALNGIIETASDVDCFKVQAKKGQVFEVECYARRIRSPLDPVMNLYDANGKNIAGNDDSRGPDSYFRFTAPADGDYVVRVTDHLGRGGPQFVYRVEFQAVHPRLSLGIPRVERYGQYRQTIFVPRGNRFGAVISAARSNFGGDLVLEENQLPQGITVHAEAMPSNLNVMPVVFEAAADAPLSGKLVDFRARHVEAEKKIQGSFRNRADFVVAAPGQSLYRWKDVERLAVAVVDKLPFRLEITQPQVPLVRNGAMQLKVIARREEGFTAPIKVELPFRPPGVGAASSVTIPEGKNEVVYPINANGNAQIRDWKVFALGSANVSGTAWVSSQLATLSVAEPYVTMELQRASCEQGQETQILCKLNHSQAFEGSAQAQLLGLPSKVTAADLEFNKETAELVFRIKTDPASPAGKHGNVFCQVTITQKGEPIVGRAGGTQLQIDKPLPPPVDQPAPKPQPKQPVAKQEPPKPPPAKPLSRLEKLRLAAAERAASRNAGTEE
ncbi:MAG: PPC domain-containing protein [Pirellulaceae bacterium]